MVIDFHTHCFPDNIAEKAINSLKVLNPLKNFGNGTEKNLVELMAKAEINYAVVLNIATNPQQVKKINEYVVNKKTEKLIYFGTLHPDFEDNIFQIEFLYQNNIKGIKLHPEFQKFFPNDKKMFKIYEKLIEKNMIVVFHSGMDDFAKNNTLYSLPDNFSIINKNFPELKIVLAHCGGHNLFDKSFEELKKHIYGKNIYIDISYSFNETNIKKLNEILNYHSENLILYGSDWPWRDLSNYKELILQSYISDEQKEKIFFKNGMKLLNL